ncbi:AMP-binding protein [Pseudonocardia sp. NPDC046786]|uniref:AMP-binding enzyme n=1 Tax=Pseudonocardia sp. NPDC046786 TaxID=3155471 RepID=UPI0033D9B157
MSKSGAVEGVTLRRASSAGEPLTPDVVAWGEKTFGTPVRDHYGQTELGMLIGNHWHDDVVHPVRDGSTGRPLPGVTADVVEGRLAVDATASPLFWFAGRDDDVILAAGYRIGPFDVESVLITHPEVADVAVAGRPDPEGVRGEVVEAFVVPAGEVTADRHAGLAGELQALVRDTYSRHAYPRTVHFVPELPRTPCGKIQRYLLRAR